MHNAQFTIAALLLVVVGTAGCEKVAAPGHAEAAALLRVGHGLGTPMRALETGVGEFINNIAFQALLRSDRKGRTGPLRLWNLEFGIES